ncbi:MAG TPA: hypothetical protein VIL46_01750 [Gemmataceae bacterium]
METDYPAAHSTDSTWYAVDRDGRVAVLFTGECGPIPNAAPDQDTMDLFRLTRRLAGEPVGLLAEGDDEGDEDDDPDWDAAIDAVIDHGFYVFDYIHNPDEIPYTAAGEGLEPYTLIGAPESALHIDQLPPDVREVFRRFRFESLNFDEAERLQPLEHAECFTWEAFVAYLTADGTTIRPIHGREEKFAAFAQDFRERHPGRAAQVRFEGPGEKREQPGA